MLSLFQLMYIKLLFDPKGGYASCVSRSGTYLIGRQLQLSPTACDGL